MNTHHIYNDLTEKKTSAPCKDLIRKNVELNNYKNIRQEALSYKVFMK